MSNWNPLYPSNDSVDPLEEAAREAEWEDDMRRAEQERQKRRGITEDEEELKDWL